MPTGADCDGSENGRHSMTCAADTASVGLCRSITNSAKRASKNALYMSAAAIALVWRHASVYCVDVLICLVWSWIIAAMRGQPVVDVETYWVVICWLITVWAISATKATEWLSNSRTCWENRHLAWSSLRRTSVRYIGQNSWHSSALRALLSRIATWRLLERYTTTTPSTVPSTPCIFAVQMSDEF